MGFNIKNNYGPNIEVNAGGKVMLVQDKSGQWHTADAEEVEYEEVTDEALQHAPENAEELPAEAGNDGCGFVPDAKAIERVLNTIAILCSGMFAPLLMNFIRGITPTLL